MQIVGMPIVASGTSAGGLMTRSSSKRKKKYHSGRGVYVVVVGSAFGPSSAPRTIDMAMIDAMTTHGHRRVLRHRVGEERLPLRLQHRVLAEVLLLLALVHARSSLGAVRRSTFCHGGAVVPSLATRYRWAPISAAIEAGHEQHVDRVEARQRRRAELGAGAQEVGEVRADERAAAR